jgi:N-acetylglutamate synthase-like GNAT family acetyltransferase
VAAADVVIDTGGSLSMTVAQFDLAWARLQRQRSRKASQANSPYPAGNHTIGSDEIGSGEIGTGHAERTLQDKVATAKSTPRLLMGTPMAERRNFDDLGPGISVRRARPEDTETIGRLIAQSTQGIANLSPTDLLSDLGERGYLLGQQGEAITAVGGWNAENLVATIDCLYVYPPEALAVTGAAILREIEITANELICEVIIALPGELAPAGTRRLLRDRGFVHVDPATLPQPWRAALEDPQGSNAAVMLKILRDTRQVRVRTLKE